MQKEIKEGRIKKDVRWRRRVGVYDRIAKVFSIGEVSYTDAFIGIMSKANAFLEYIELNIDELTATK